jgi:hypothetical protein
VRRPLAGTTARAFRREPGRQISITTLTCSSRAPQTSPQARLTASIGDLLRALLGMNGGLKGSSQPNMLDTLDVLFEDGLSSRIIERRDRLADLIARAPKEGRCRPPPLPTERVNSIRHHQHCELVLRISRNRETQKQEQPFVNLLGASIRQINCAIRCAQSGGNRGRAPFRCAACALRRAPCMRRNPRSHGTRPFCRGSMNTQ